MFLRAKQIGAKFGTRLFTYTPSHRSAHRPSAAARLTTFDLRKLYNESTPISVVTAHDYLTARMADASDADMVLVGDSLAMTSLGMRDTNLLNLDEFLYHVKLVSRGCDRSFLIADLPFGLFELLVEQAVDTAVQIIKSGAQAVKIEGGHDAIIPTITKLVQIGIPVMGHVGLTPQLQNQLGGFRVQGNAVEPALKILQECKRLQDAGVFALLIECVPAKLAQHITETVNVPTIGIGAGNYTLGQVLVIADALGMQDPTTLHKPKFLKQYLNLFDQSVKALQNYRQDVKTRQFPADEHTYKIKPEVFSEYLDQVGKSDGTN